MAAIELGAGRLNKDDVINHRTGIVFLPKIGDKINKGDLIAKVFSDKKGTIQSVGDRILNAVHLSDKKIKPLKLIKEIIN
jgi:thymidine phosphorylase